MTFEIPEHIKNQALMINALHYMMKTSESSFEGVTELVGRNATGQTLSSENLHKVFMHIAHQFMTFNLLCEEMLDHFMEESREFSKDHGAYRDEIQEQLKAHPFMQKMMKIVSEDDKDRALRLIVETGMPEDLADDIRAMMNDEH